MKRCGDMRLYERDKSTYGYGMKLFTTSLVLSFFLPISLVFAQANGDGTLSVETDISSTQSIELDTDSASAQAQENAKIRASASSSLQAQIAQDSNPTQRDTQGVGNATSSEMQANDLKPQPREKQPGDDEFLTGNVISAAAKDVRGWNPTEKQQFLANVKTFAQVQSGQDLEQFAQGVFLKDENITDVHYSNSELSIEYKGKAKLFAFIPFKYTHRVVVDTNAPASNRVKVHFPWYGFLLKSGIDPEFIKTAIAVDLSGDLASSDLGLRTSAYASALETVAKVLKKRHEIAVNIIAQ